jgi:tRNA(Ile)-lysidine synthase
MPGDNSKIGIAVSGGPDSLALLLLMHECFPGQFAAATVDHQLRAEAADEARYVATLCAAHGVQHTILTPTSPIEGSIQASARAARYGLLSDWADKNACTHIATAHHADDQLETLLMRLARGSGVDGMSGVRRVNGRIIRPLLAFGKAELEAICTAVGVSAVQDPSNKDIDFDRVRMREWLASAPHPLNPSAAVRSAAALGEASVALDWMTRQMSSERIQEGLQQVTVKVADLPRELQRRLLLHALAIIEPNTVHKGAAIERGLSALNAGQTVTLGNILCKGGDTWYLSPAPPRSSHQTALR